jgi:hypothetical protein
MLDTGNKTTKPGTDREQRGNRKCPYFTVVSSFLLLPVPGFPGSRGILARPRALRCGTGDVRVVDNLLVTPVGNREHIPQKCIICRNNKAQTCSRLPGT